MRSKPRQRIFIAGFLLLALMGAACKQRVTAVVTHEGVGVIEEVDTEASVIQINHEAIDDYMPAMSMPYKVKDKALLEKIKTGDKVAFTVEDSAAGIFVIDVKKQGR